MGRVVQAAHQDQLLLSIRRDKPETPLHSRSFGRVPRQPAHFVESDWWDMAIPR